MWPSRRCTRCACAASRCWTSSPWPRSSSFARWPAAPPRACRSRAGSSSSPPSARCSSWPASARASGPSSARSAPTARRGRGPRWPSTPTSTCARSGPWPSAWRSPRTACGPSTSPTSSAGRGPSCPSSPSPCSCCATACSSTAVAAARPRTSCSATADCRSAPWCGSCSWPSVSTSATDLRAPAALTEGAGELLTGWGRTSPSRARVHRPGGPEEVAAVVAAAGPRGVLARGLGRAYGDAAQNAGGEVLACAGLAGVRELDAAAGEVTVAAGTSLGDLARAVLPHGWFPAVVPGTRHVTVGGAIAADVHGKNHHRDGAFGAHVRALELVTPDGERRRVARAEDPAAFGATLGGMGLTGVVVEATLRLQRVESDYARVDTERAGDIDGVLASLTEGDRRAPPPLAWGDCLSGGRPLGPRGVSFGGDAP